MGNKPTVIGGPDDETKLLVELTKIVLRTAPMHNGEQVELLKKLKPVEARLRGKHNSG